MAGTLLPPEFSDLEPWAPTWCPATEPERWARRLRSSIQELQAFYDACFPRARFDATQEVSSTRKRHEAEQAVTRRAPVCTRERGCPALGDLALAGDLRLRALGKSADGPEGGGSEARMGERQMPERGDRCGLRALDDLFKF